MKKSFILAGAISITALLVLAATRTEQSGEFGDLIKKIYAAWSTLDADNAAPFYAKDADLTFFDLAPLKYTHGWKEYSDNFRTNVATVFTNLVMTANDDLKVTKKGDLAFTTSTFHLAIKSKDGSPMEFDGRHTLIWEKRDGKWLIIHEHASKPL